MIYNLVSDRSGSVKPLRNGRLGERERERERESKEECCVNVT
jgi:hypothetical protein